MSIQKYISDVLAHIKNKTFKKEIEEELESHIENRKQYYLKSGCDEKVSLTKAIEQMGNPNDVGEKMNKIYYNLPALYTSFAMILIYALGIAYFYYCVDFTNLLNETINKSIEEMVISFICFLASSNCFYLCYKNRFGKTAILLGIVNIISLFSFYIFIPIGCSIFGFFFDFPAVFVDKEFYFFENSFLNGYFIIVSDFLYFFLTSYIGILLVSLFFISPIVNAVISIIMGINMLSNKFYKKKKHYKRFSVILITLTFVCLFTITVEISADFIKSLILQ